MQLPVAPACLAAALLLVPVTAPGSGEAVTGSKFELFVTDVADSVRFYATLGFTVAHEKPDGYTTLRSGTTVIALSPVPSWLPLRWFGFLRYPPIGTEIVLYSDRLEEQRASLIAAGWAPGEIARQPWGDRDFRISDPDGYYIRVSEGKPIPVAEASGRGGSRRSVRPRDGDRDRGAIGRTRVRRDMRALDRALALGSPLFFRVRSS